MSRCHNDCWGKALLMAATLFLVAPCILHGLFHLAHPHMHGPGGLMRRGEGPEHPGPEGHHGGRGGMMRRPRGTGEGAMGGEGPRRDECDGDQSHEMPPMAHPHFHHAVFFFAVLSVGAAFCSPSRCRGRLGLALVLALVLGFPFPLRALSHHADARTKYCSHLATHHVTNFIVQSVSIGPFEAISVVRAPTTKTVDADELMQCVDAVEKKVKFVATVLWLVFTILLTCTSGLTISDLKRFGRQGKKNGKEGEDNEEEKEEKKALVLPVCNIAEEGDVFPVSRQSTMIYAKVDTIEHDE